MVVVVVVVVVAVDDDDDDFAAISNVKELSQLSEDRSEPHQRYQEGTTYEATRPGDNGIGWRCHSEVETLAHILSSRPFGETLRNSRHHKIRSLIATCLKSNGYITYEEVHGIADTGSLRRIDIITFKPGETDYQIRDASESTRGGQSREKGNL
ncbi:hypothetical protein ANN_15294 [Periplaneta americana]|uniref:Uncharacterized protein n=1 Tax=Periplaneta americana TaxID=6978 RepID=A0ABQ8SH31_PERAM|nr:hypothetical protein ANN_15294 [Periplaneta americana]